MKRRFALSALVGLGLCLGHNALAANLPMPAMAPPPPKPLSWTGFYLGGNASFPWTDPVTFTAADPQGAIGSGPGGLPLSAVTMSAADIGFFGGPQLGYNMQLGSFLLGAEGDIGWGVLSMSAIQTPLVCCAPFGPFPLSPASAATAKLEVSSLSTVRGRAGWIWNNPKSESTFNMAGDFLFYGTGGVAFANTSYTSDLSCPFIPVAQPFNCVPLPPIGNNGVHAPISMHHTQTGDVWGGGVEWLTLASKGKIIWGIEYLHYHFKGNAATGLTVNAATGAPVSFSATCPAGTACVGYTSSALNINDVRVRASYIWN
jgi:opacity protein-like surface antigen